MKEIRGDLFQQVCDAICITTNGCTKRNGECVMGRGCAFQAKERWPGLPGELGAYLQQYGNRCFWFSKYKVITFPTKKHWKKPSEIELIKKSCGELMVMMDKFNLNDVILPKPGCSNGQLNWNEVKEEIKDLLDDRVTIIDR